MEHRVFDELNGPQKEILQQAILAAFPKEGGFDMFAQGKLDMPPLEQWAEGDNYAHTAFVAIGEVGARGRLRRLIAALQLERADNVLVRNLPDALRLAAKPKVPPTAEGGMTLEGIVRRGGFKNFRGWGEKFSSIGQAICRIDYPVAGRTGFGTGLLVADDMVLTNYHVVARHIAGELDAKTITCRFDYASDVDGKRFGREAKLAEGNTWNLRFSKYDDSDKTGTGEPAADRLDFALVKLAEPVAQDELAGGQRRGALQMRSDVAKPIEGDPVFVVQHPSGAPLALTIGIAKQSTTSRLRYDADTLGGSSGSGVFNATLDLVALHHAGHPGAELLPPYNQGIPVGRIRDSLGPQWNNGN